jgi:hypothetical protein
VPRVPRDSVTKAAHGFFLPSSMEADDTRCSSTPGRRCPSLICGTRRPPHHGVDNVIALAALTPCVGRCTTAEGYQICLATIGRTRFHRRVATGREPEIEKRGSGHHRPTTTRRRDPVTATTTTTNHHYLSRNRLGRRVPPLAPQLPHAACTDCLPRSTRPLPTGCHPTIPR